MRIWQTRSYPFATIFLVLSFMTISMYGSIGGLSPDDPPDIEMVSLMAEPDPEGDFDISMIVKNRGGEISDECESIFWDETDIITGNRTLIGQMMIPPIEPGKVYEVRLKWDPRTSDPHRIWGVVDPDSDILEASKSNNIGSILVQMPKVKSVRTTIDGNPDAKIIGDLITGVPFDLPLTVEMDMPVNPSLMKIYIEMEDGSQVFVPFQADQTFRKSIDATVFSKGDNNITVNASYALIGSEPVTYLVRTRELPSFLSNLIDLQVDFIPQGPHYEASGYLDIPDLAMVLPLDGISEGVEVSVFSGTRDVFVTANIMLDGAATLLFDGSPIFSVPGGGSISDISSEHLIEDLWSENSIGLSGDFELPLTPLLQGFVISDSVLEDGRSISSPVQLVASGNVAYDVVFTIGSSEDEEMSIEMDFDLSGNGSSIGSINFPGFDDPTLFVNSSTRLIGNFAYHGNGPWKWEGETNVRTSISGADTGLVISGGSETEGLPEFGKDSDMKFSPNGLPATVQIRKGSGHNTAVTYIHNGSKYQVVSDNRYKSSPGLAYLEDGSPLVVWTKSMDWSPDPIQRMSSMELRFSKGDPNGMFPDNSSSVYPSGKMQLHPDVTSNREGTVVLVWTEDIDSDPVTLDDCEIMMSTFSGQSWSEPAKVTSDNLWDDHPHVGIDGDGIIWISWLSEGGKGRFRTFDTVSGNWGLTRSLLAGNDELEEVMSVEPSLDGGDISFAVHSRSVESGGENIIRILRFGLDGNGPQDVQEIETTLGSISGLYASCDIGSSPLITWTADEGSGGDIYVSRKDISSSSRNWTDPLPIESDEIAQIAPVLLSIGKGSFLAAFLEIEGTGSNLSIASRLQEIDLSNAGSIVDSGYDLLGDYKKWETVVIYLDVMNVGLAEEGTIYVNLDRESRDPTTGEVSRISVSSKLVQFSAFGEVKEVEFTTTLVEHQLRYSVWTASGWGDPPALISEDHVDLPVTSDPWIESMAATYPNDETLLSQVTLDVRNSGLVAVDPLIIEVMAEVGSELEDITGSGFEPAGIRKVEDAVSLNSTSDGLGSKTSETYVMNITLGPGRNVIWALLTMPDGRRTIKGPIFIDLFPELVFVPCEDMIMIERDSSLTVELQIENRGPVASGPGNEETRLSLSLSIEEIGGAIVMGPYFLTGPLPSSSNLTTISFNSSIKDLGPGHYVIKASIINLSGIPGIRNVDADQVRDLAILENADIAITGRVEGDLGFRGREFRVNVSNLSNRTLGICRVVLFNGYPGDGVVISEGFILDVNPNGTGQVSLPFDLDTGLYYLSITASTSSYLETAVPWNETVWANISFEHPVKETASDLGEEEEVDMGDVNDTILVGASAIFTVILISALFRRKDQNDEKDG